MQQGVNEPGEDQEIKRFTRRHDGVLPERELETADQRGEHRWHPRGGDAEERVFTALDVALAAGAVVRQQGDGTGEQADGERGAGGGEEVQREELDAGGQPADGTGQQNLERRDEIRAPFPARDARERSHAAETRGLVQGDEVDDQRREGDDPREAALNKSEFDFGL